MTVSRALELIRQRARWRRDDHRQLLALELELVAQEVADEAGLAVTENLSVVRCQACGTVVTLRRSTTH